MGKVAVYARVSLKDRQDFSRQVSDCKTVIGNKYSENDIEIFGEQISGYKENERRPQLMKMLEIIENDPKYFDCIYVTEISRLGRNPKTTRTLIDNLTDKNIPVYITSINRKTLEDNGERDSVMNIVLQVLMEFSDSESRTMKKRSISGLLQSAKSGKAGAGKYLPYGYKKDLDKQLIVDDEEAEVIKEIFDLYNKGNGFKRIAGYLNEKKVPTRGNIAFGNQVMNFNTPKTASKIIWSDKSVMDIITNPIYKGQRRYKGDKLSDDDKAYTGHVTKRGEERFKTIYLKAPLIIETELFDACNDIRLSKTHRNSVIKYNYLLKDLLICGICGRNMFAKYKPVPQGDKVYICSSRLKKGGNCGNQGVNISYIESVIYDMLIGQKVLLDRIDQSDKMLPSVKLEIEKLNKQLSFEENELTKQNKKINRWSLLFRDTDMSIEQYNEVAAKDKNSIGTISNKIELLKKSLKEQNEILLKISNKTKDADFLTNLSRDRPAIISIFKQFIKNIYITKMPVDGDMLLDVHFTIGKKIPESTLKIMIDQFATRYKSKTQFTYRVIGKMLTTNYDEKGILLTSQDKIYGPFITDIGKHKWIVPSENILIL